MRPILALPLLAACAAAPARLDADRTDPGTDDTGSAASVFTETWDPSPRDALAGAVSSWQVECSLLEGAPIRDFRKVDDALQRWKMVIPDTPDLRPELTPCMTDGESYLEWYDDGSIDIWAGDLYHEMNPTLTPDRWVGTAWLWSGSTPACDEALASVGLSWPVGLSIELVAIVDP